MCGRYDYTPGEFRDIRIRWNLDNDLPQFKPTYNMAPGKDVPVIVREGERNQMKLMRWGLVSSWAKDPSIGNRMINARARNARGETLLQAPAQFAALSCPRGWVLRNGLIGSQHCIRGKNGDFTTHLRLNY